MDNFIANPCRTYFIRIDNLGQPLMGTMFSKDTAKLDTGPCNEAILPPVQMTPGAGQRQCFFPNGNRYFYQISNISGRIIPNSMILVSGQNKPPMCVGTHQYLEYQNYTGQNVNAIIG